MKCDIESCIYRNYIFIIFGFFIIIVGLIFYNFISHIIGGIIIGLIIGGLLGLGAGILLGLIIKRNKLIEYLGLIFGIYWIHFIVGSQNTFSFEEVEDLPHEAIILAYEKNATKYFLYSLGVDILVDSFTNNKIPYWIYECFNKHQFVEFLRNPKINSVWIFGHGVRHGVDFGHEIGYYCEINITHKFEFIGQYHCCHGGGNSLADYYKPKNFDITYDFRNAKETRASIRNILAQRGIEAKSESQLFFSALTIIFSRIIRSIKFINS